MENKPVTDEQLTLVLGSIKELRTDVMSRFEQIDKRFVEIETEVKLVGGLSKMASGLIQAATIAIIAGVLLQIVLSFNHVETTTTIYKLFG